MKTMKRLALATGALMLAFNLSSPVTVTAHPAGDDPRESAAGKDEARSDAAVTAPSQSALRTRDAESYFKFALANSKNPNHVLHALERTEEILTENGGGADWAKVGTTAGMVKTLRVKAYYQLARRFGEEARTIGSCNALTGTKESLQAAADIAGGALRWDIAGLSAREAEKFEAECLPPEAIRGTEPRLP